jgi:hypothetical protein
MQTGPMISNVVRFSGYCVCAALAMVVPAQGQVYFSPEERSRVIEYWSQGDRYVSSLLPDAAANGSWRARQTAEGSRWLWQYNRRLRPGKGNPVVDPKAANAKQAAWDAWLDRRIAFDHAKAAQAAAEKNRAENPGAALAPVEQASDPGSPPSDLVELAGEPPAFARAVQPQQHSVRFDSGAPLVYADNVPMRRKFLYYRFPEGIQSGGQRVRDMAPAQLQSLFEEAGLSEREMKVMKSVSLLEGGFDSINTYDTGFVSAGFIQFAALDRGSGSLGQVLLRLKSASFGDFDSYFRRFGLEVTDAGELVALCPSSGAEFIGSGAAMKIISDRRLASVFQHAGRESRAYRVAQLQVAKKMYYPGDDVVRITRNGVTDTVRVSQIFRTEAGIATLMDRKVNTGSLGNLTSVLQSAADRTGVDDLSKLALVEYDLIRQMQWRKDYLSDATLSRPRDTSADNPARAGARRSSTPSRSSSRAGRSASSRQRP